MPKLVSFVAFGSGSLQYPSSVILASIVGVLELRIDLPSLSTVSLPNEAFAKAVECKTMSRGVATV